MKRILIIHTNMELGGAETSLLGLLHSIDYSRYAVDLFLLEQKGELLRHIPEQVNLITPDRRYLGVVLPIKDVLLCQHQLGMTAARLLGRLKGRNAADSTYAIKQYAQNYEMQFLPRIPGTYDMAISFIDPHFIVEQKVDAKVKLGWIHTDFSRIEVDRGIDFPMWNELNFIVNVSQACKEKFDWLYPELSSKSIVMENILAEQFVYTRAEAEDIHSEMPEDGSIRLLSIGRFCEAKNFDNIPSICKFLVQQYGLDLHWYLIGYGGGEQKIRNAIVAAGMESNVIILGKKENPYPYLKGCDLYVQPSRYEGKCVTVREAQMLGKPVVITDYATSASQLENGVDGIVVPMDNEGCARGIAELLKDPRRMQELSENCKKRDYSNRREVEKLYQLLEH